MTKANGIAERIDFIADRIDRERFASSDHGLYPRRSTPTEASEAAKMTKTNRTVIFFFSYAQQIHSYRTRALPSVAQI